jgi:microcystin-dependent protein
MFGGNFQIRGFAFCNGQLMAISQNDALFALIGTTYGGDGVNTFGLPNMQGRIPVHQGTLAGGGSYAMGQQGGVEQVTLTTSTIPSHSHLPGCDATGGSSGSPAGGVWGLATDGRYSGGAQTAAMNTAGIGLNSGNQPHDNMLPFLCFNFIIALEGVFPPQ